MSEEQLRRELATLERILESNAVEIQRLRVLVRDLRIHLADRDRHIRNLEAELRPLILAPAVAEGQERML